MGKKQEKKKKLEARKSAESLGRRNKSSIGRPSPLDAIERWLASHSRLVVTVIVAVSILLRIIYFVEINGSPCLWQHRWTETDMNFFDVWGREIAAGDWLTNKAFHPHHSWHQVAADVYFRAHPEAAAALARSGAPDSIQLSPARVLWNHWYGDKRFHQEPLYPYLVALTYKLWGPDVRWVFAWQMVLGVLINVLVYLIARRHFGALVATVAGLFAILCGPLLFYEMSLLRETLITFVGLGLVYVADRAIERGTWPGWLLTGLACGLAVVLKTPFLLFWCGLLGLLVYRYRQTPQVLYRFAAALIGGLVLCLVPVIARNVAVGASPLGLSSVGTIGFISANAEDYAPEVGSFISMKHAPRIMADTNGRFLAAAVETLKTHKTVQSYIEQLWRKFALMWHWYEEPDNNNFYYYRLHAAVLRCTFVTFLILAPLAIVGWVLAARCLGSCVPLYLLVINSMASLLLFYVLSRYRVPLMAALIPFAALALVRIAQWVWAKQIVESMIAIIAVALLSLWTMRPLPEQKPLIRLIDYTMPYDFYYNPLLQQAGDNKDWRRAADILKDSLRSEPAEIQQMGHARPAMQPWESRVASFFAGVHQTYAQILQNAGQMGAAREQAQRAEELRQAAGVSK